MPPRASWKGQIRLSLVSFPVCLYNATSGAARISMNQLHRDCHRRLKQQMTCPEHGPVERADIVKGYEYEKDRYVIVEESDLESIKLETTKCIEMTQFIDEDELDPIYSETPYFVAPDGPMAQDAFRVIREAMRRNGKIGIGRVVMAGRENIVSLKVHERGFMLTTLRAADEVRHAAPYMEDIRDGEVDKDQLKLAEQLIESREAPYDPSQLRDRYQDALLAMIKAKIEGSAPVVVQEAEAGRVINLMEALKQSLADAPLRKKPAARSVKTVGARKERKSKRA
ncbi:MAG: Non-homologous end joining protein Ku [Phycisphaerae bacterium]|nr:Non-homologous end joining protein Ku [Phycisphaerae bacterium]